MESTGARQGVRMIKSYTDLQIYKDAYRLSLDIYKLTQKFPKEETYGIISQIRRAAVSVALNIAEGYGRQSKEEFRRFLKISLGSNNETMTLLELSKDLEYLNIEEYQKLKNQYILLGKRIHKVIECWK